MKTFRQLALLTCLILGVLARGSLFGATTIISDNYNVTASGTGFNLNAGVNTGINPPTTRLTGSTISNLRYLQTVTSRPASAYDINSSRARVTTGNNIGRFTLSANGSTPFDFGPALGTSYATPANPVVYDVKISMRNDATGNPRFSLGLATVEGDINNMDFAIQMYRANTGHNYYTLQKRIDRGSFNGTTTTDGTGDVNAVMTTTASGTHATMIDFLIRVTDAGAESGGNYNSRIQVSIDNGSSWIYDTDSDSAVSNRFRFDAATRYFAFDQAPNTTGNVFYDGFSVTWNSGPRGWTGGGANGNWNTAANWGGAVPASGDKLIFSGTTRQTNTNDLSGLSVPWISFNNGGFALYGNALTVSGAISNVAGNSALNNAVTAGGALKFQSDAGTLTLGGNITGGANNLTADGAGNTTASGVVSGTGSLTKNGSGTLQLSGASANTISGNTLVNAGTLSLVKTAGVNAIVGNITVGDGSGSDVLQLSAANQISDSATVTISSSGTFNLNGFGETVAAVSSVSSASQIALGAGTLTVGDSSTNTFVGIISGTGGLVKQGSGTFALSGANTFSGNTTVSAGRLTLDVGGSISNSATITIANGATLDAVAVNLSRGSGQTLACSTVNGIGFVNGAVTLNSGAQISLQADGAGKTIGYLSIEGDVTFNGNTFTINVVNSPLGMGTYPVLDYTGFKSGSFNTTPTITGAGIAAGLLYELRENAADGIELHVYPSPRIWTGAGADNHWATAANWTNNFAPSGEDPIIFNGTTRQNNTNNLSGLTIESLTFNNGGFTVNGNALVNTFGVTNFSGVNTLKGDLSWTSSESKIWSVAGGSELVLDNTNTAEVVGNHELVGGGTLRLKKTMNLGAVDAEPVFIVNEGKHIIDGGALASSGGYYIGSDLTSTTAHTILTNGASLLLTAGAMLSVGEFDNPVTSRLDLHNSTIDLSGGFLALPFSAGATGVVNQVGGSVSNVIVSFSDFGEGDGSYTISNGELTAIQIVEYFPGTSAIYFNNATLRTATDADATFMTGLDIAEIQSGGLTIDASVDVNIDQELSGSGALIKIGANKVTIGGANTYAGNTTIDAGTLAIGADGSIANSPTLNLANGATLDISAGNFSISGNQTLVRHTASGAGNVNGSLTLNSGAQLILSATGSGNTVGSIAVTGGLTLNGNTVTINVTGASLGASTNTIISYTGAKTGSLNLVPVITGSSLAAGMTADIFETAGAIVLRVYAGPRIWTGNGSDDNWSNGVNWLGAAPTSGHSIFFNGTTRQNNTNNISGLSIPSLVFNNGGFTLNGNALTVTNSVTNLVGVNTFKNEIAWGTVGAKTWHVASGSELRLDGLHTVEVNGDQTFYGGGVMRLTGTLNAGQSTSANGAFVINEGTFIADGGTLNSLGGYRIGANASSQSAQTALILTNGASINITGTGSNIRVGNSLNNGTGRLNIYNSTVVLNAAGISIPYTAGATGIVTQIGGMVSNCIIMFSDTGAGTGSYTVKDGILAPLQIREDTASGSASIYFDNATLRAYSGAVGSTYFTGLNLARIESGGLTIQASVGVTIGQVLSGPGALTKTGGNKVTFTGANTYSGNTAINSGTIALGAGGSIANSPTIAIANGATFDVSVSGFTLGTGKTLACSSTSGSGSITGNIVLSSGSLGSFQANGSSSTVGSLAITGNLTANGNTLNVNVTGAPLNVGTYTLISYTGTKTGSFNAAPVITGLGLNPGLSADIQEVAGQINLRVQQLARVWDGGGANDNWSASANWDNVVPGNGDRVVFAGSTRQSNTNDLSSLSLASITFSNGGFTLNGNVLTLSGAITNLVGANTYKHDIAWSSSAAKVWNIASGSEIILDNTNTVEVSGDHNLIGGGTVWLKKRMNIGQATTNNPAIVLQEGNQIIDGGTLATRGDYRIGSLETGAGGKTILTNSATLMLTAPGAILRVGDSANATASVLNIHNSSVILSNANLALPYAAGASGQVSQNGGTISGGVINYNQNGAGTGVYTIASGALEALQIKKSTAGGQSEIYFNNATLRSLSGASNAFFSGLDVAEIQSGGLIFNATADATVAQSLSGSGSLTKTGANKLTLSGANSFSGNTLVNAGTLAIDAGGSIASSPNIVLVSGVVLDISATTFALEGSQIISCSSTSGTATITGSATLNADAQVSLQINGSNGSVGVLNVAGNLTLNDNTIVIHVNNAVLGVGTNTLITYTGSKSGSFHFAPVITGLGLGSGLRAEIQETSGAIKLRVFSDTRTWTGGGANNNWSTAANWTGSAPVTGDDLIFNGATRQNNTNNMSGLNVLSVTFNNGGFTLNGNTFNNNSAITNLAGVNTIKAGLTWVSTAAKTWNIAGGSELVLSNTTTVDVGGNHTFFGGGTLKIKGAMNVGQASSAQPNLFVNDAKIIIDGGSLIARAGYRLGAAATGTTETILTNGAVLAMTTSGGNIRVGDASNPATVRLSMHNSTVTLAGGNLSIPYESGATSIVSQVGGTISGGTINFNHGGAGKGIYTNANGTLEAVQIKKNNAGGQSEIHFDNAVLRTAAGANSTFFTGLEVAKILSGGLTMEATADVTVGQALSGTGGLTKTGASKVTLTAVNSFSGALNVSAGNLTVAAGGSIASATDYGITSGATLDVSGITFTVANTETLSCNSGSGTANVVGNVTLNSGAFYSTKATGPSTVAKIAVTGNITVNNNTITVNVSGAKLGVGTYPVLTFTGSRTGTFNLNPNITGLGLASGLAARIQHSSGTVSLNVYSPAPTNTIFRVMAYNIHWALGPDGQVNTDRIANYVLNKNIDLVGFNEVARFWPQRAQGRDIIGEIAQKTGYSFVFTNNKTDLSGNDSFGNAILSKFPILFKDHRFLPKVGDNEQRGWLKAVVDIKGKFVSFQTTHLDFHANDRERLMCGTNLNIWVQEETLPAMIVGDFNDTPNGPICNLMDKEWLDIWPGAGDGTLGRTVPCPGPPGARIDYIFKARGSTLTATNAFVGLTIEASDHFPVISDFILTSSTNNKPGFSFAFNAGTGTNVVDSIGNLKGTLGTGTPTWNTNSPTGHSSDYSLWFNGNKKLVVPDPKQIIGTNGLNGDYTLQTWVKIAVNYAPTERAILFQYERKPGFSLSINTNRTLHTTVFKMQDISTSAAIPNDGQWHHVAVVHTSGQNMKFYIDGSLAATVAYTGGAGNRVDSRIVMGSDFDNNNQFTGFLDRVKFDNSVLIPGELDYPAGSSPRSPNNDFEAWLALHGITDPNGDADGDGQDNFAEFVANTNPNDASSLLQILDAKRNAEGEFIVTWSSIGGTRYRLQYANSLDGEFTDIERDEELERDANSFGADSTQSFSDALAPTNSARYYRIKIVP